MQLQFIYITKTFKAFDKYNVKKKKAAKIPQNEEVDRIEVRKQNEVARLALEDVKKKHRDKMTKLKARKDNLKQVGYNIYVYKYF